jgi:DNA-binding CsgD family transcriptional regulator
MGSQDPDDRSGRPAHEVDRPTRLQPRDPNATTSTTLRPAPAMLPVRGRADCVAVIDDLIAELQDGREAVLLIEGPPGIGKTRLVREVAARATRAGSQALSGRAYEDQHTVPFAPLLDAVLRANPPLCDAAVLRELSATTDSRYWVVRDLRDAIASAAARAPVAVCIDDVHWADAGTTVALHALTTELEQAPVLWTLAMRSSGGRSEARDAIGAIVTALGPAGHWRRLGALDAQAVEQIAGDVLSASVDESVLRLASTVNGNPFLLLELLRGLHEEDRIHIAGGRAWATGSNLPQRLAATMQRRLDRLSPMARHAVQVASILPESFSAELLARALSQSPTHVVASVDEAVRADLLSGDGDHLGFRHNLLRRAVQQTIPHAMHCAVERESAAILLELGASPEEVAAQLVRSATVGDLPAVTALREAAQSVARSDPSGGADLSRRALELLRHDDAGRTAVVNETVVLLNQALRYDEAKQLAAASLSSDMPAEQEAQIRLSLSIGSSDWPRRRVDENRRALQLPNISAQTRARHLGWLAFNLALDGQTRAVRDAALTALTAASEVNDIEAQLVAEFALASVDCVEGHQQRCLHRLTEMRPHFWASEAGVTGLVAAVSFANMLVTLGRLSDAKAVFADALQNTRRVHNAAGEQVVFMMQAFCEFAAGNLARAHTIVVDLLPEGERLRADTIAGRGGLLLMGAIAAHTDDRPLVIQVGIAARAALEGGPAIRREAIAALSHAAWQRGDEAEAARWLGEDLEVLTTPMWAVDVDHVVLAARVARTSSDAGLRQRVLGAVEALERDGREDTLFFAVALHARGLLEEDLDALEKAAVALADSARPVLHAGALEDTGHAMAQRGSNDLAAERLSRAFDIFAAHSCVADAHRVARALHELGVHRRVVRQREQTGWDSLTAAELRVLELVADGATNREMAHRLSVSPHTVNTHVRNIFAKLNIHSRAELIRLARGR